MGCIIVVVIAVVHGLEYQQMYAADCGRAITAICCCNDVIATTLTAIRGGRVEGWRDVIVVAKPLGENVGERGGRGNGVDEDRGEILTGG